MPEAMGNWLGWYEEAAHNNREEAARVEREAEREVEREEWWAMRQDVVRRVREDVRSGGWHRWVMSSGEVWSVGLEEAERCMAVAEAEAGAAKHDEAEEATAAAVWRRGADRWGAGPAAAAQRRVVRGAELTAAMAEETRGGIRAVAGWMEVAERGTDRMAWQLCIMVADAVAWAVEEWGEAEAGAVAWRLAAREVEEAREAERALWSEVEERRREDRELVDATNALATALEGVAAEVEVAAEVAAPSGHR